MRRNSRNRKKTKNKNFIKFLSISLIILLLVLIIVFITNNLNFKSTNNSDFATDNAFSQNSEDKCFL